MKPSFTPSLSPRPIVDPDDRPDWRARWIQNPAFFLRTCRELRPCPREAPKGSDIQNVHSFYRRTWELPRGEIRRATLRVTADDHYRLYLNGAFLAMGPAQSVPFNYYYNIYDLTGLIPDGRLTLAAHVYYFGLPSFNYVSADNLEGLFMQLELEYADGRLERLITDREWRIMTCGAWQGHASYGYATQFAEDLLLEGLPEGWQSPDFDDSGWAHVSVRGAPYPPPYRLVPQPTPPLERGIARPVSITKVGPREFRLDFGHELVGITELRVHGEFNQVIEIRHGEELMENGRVRTRGKGGGFRYVDYATLTGRPEKIELFDQKGFRYVELCNWCEDELNPEDVRVITLNYPFPENGGMSCSDSTFERIWRICADGARWGTQDTYYDCPTREKGGFLGDAYITAATHLLITGDPRILRKLLIDFAVSLRQDPVMTDVAPAYITGGLTDYTLLYPSLIERYWMHTGDLKLVRSLLFAIESVHEWIGMNLDENGLLKGCHSPIDGSEQTLIDWPRPYREKYDFDGAKDSANSVLNAGYYGFCQSSARLYDACGEHREAGRMRARAGEIAEAMVRTMFDPVRGLFTDHVNTMNCTLHGNAPALCHGVPFPGGNGRAADFVAREGLNCGVYFAYFVIKGLFNAGRTEDAWRLLAGDAENSWQTMLNNGATTCWETWSMYNREANGSQCHPWSSSPVSFWAEEICGVRPTSPGWETYGVSPRIPAALTGGSVRVPTPRGTVEVSFARRDGELSVSQRLDTRSPAIF